jgi:hypothetical protein
MKNSTLDSLQPRTEAARRTENALNGVRRKGEIGFTVESGLLILIKRIMKALSRERMRRTC